MQSKASATSTFWLILLLTTAMVQVVLLVLNYTTVAAKRGAERWAAITVAVDAIF
jgi:hypothetical protein